MNEDEIEGAVTRNLFRTDSDSSDEDDCHAVVDPIAENRRFSGTRATLRREVLHVTLEEKVGEVSIAQQLWPAAEFLARYILDVAESLETQASIDLNTHVSICSRENEQRSSAFRALQEALESKNSEKAAPIIELGAGLGLTGLEIATQLSVHVLSTELEEGIPMLKTIITVNKSAFKLGEKAVEAQELMWGNKAQSQDALLWYERVCGGVPRPLVVLGSDVVYWEELHDPLERTLYDLLSNTPPGSICILAGMRRWKSDTSFYKTLGKRSRTASHELYCSLLKEDLRRSEGSRQIMRIYAVQWVERETKKAKRADGKMQLGFQ
jgi:hypothetical protein